MTPLINALNYTFVFGDKKKNLELHYNETFSKIHMVNQMGITCYQWSDKSVRQ